MKVNVIVYFFFFSLLTFYDAKAAICARNQTGLIMKACQGMDCKPLLAGQTVKFPDGYGLKITLYMPNKVTRDYSDKLKSGDTLELKKHDVVEVKAEIKHNSCS